MIMPHDQVLTAIEHRVARQGDRPDAVDHRVAAELGVPAEAYFTYLLVWGMVERYRDRELCHLHLAAAPDALTDALARARALVASIGEAAVAVYRDSVGGGHADVHEAAGRMAAAALQRHACLDQLAASHAPMPSGHVAGNGEEAVRDAR